MAASQMARRFARGVAWNQIGTVLLSGIGVATSIVLTRYLGAAQYGIYATLVSLGSSAVLFSSLGIDKTLLNYLPRFREAGEPGKVRYLFRTLLSIQVVAGLITGVLILFFADALSKLLGGAIPASMIRIVAVLAFFNSAREALRATQVAFLRTKIATLVDSATRAALLVGAVAIVLAGGGIRSLLILLCAVAVVTVFIYLGRTGEFLKGSTEKTDSAPWVKFGLTLWVIVLFQHLLGKEIDIYFLNAYLKDPSQVAYYRIAVSLEALVGAFFFRSAGNLMLPVYSASLARGGVELLGKVWRTALKVTSGAVLPVLAFLLVNAGPVIRGVYTEEFDPSVRLLWVYGAFRLLIYALGCGFSVDVLYTLEKQRLGLAFRLTAGVINVILDILLIPRYGPMGAVIATGSSFLFTGLLELIAVSRHVPIRYPLGFTLRYGISLGVALLPSFLFPAQGLLGVFLHGVVYGVLLILLCLVTRPLDADDHKALHDLSPRMAALLKRF